MPADSLAIHSLGKEGLFVCDSRIDSCAVAFVCFPEVRFCTSFILECLIFFKTKQKRRLPPVGLKGTVSGGEKENEKKNFIGAFAACCMHSGAGILLRHGGSRGRVHGLR